MATNSIPNAETVNTMPTHTKSISGLMEQSGVGFGTSGARGRVEDMTDAVCYAYTAAFLQYMEQELGLEHDSAVAIGGDLRPSTPRIMAATAKAARDRGYQVVNCGFVPTPAVALYGIQHGVPAIMVTGSHIPDDRNGIKFNKPEGEILKSDEAAIKAQTVEMPVDHFDQQGGILTPSALPPFDRSVRDRYVSRYLDFFPKDCLKNATVGVYEHSSVARDLLAVIFEGLGAEVIRLDRSDTFIPVDTEAVRPEDIEKARQWSAEGRFDCIVSADGDGDRPLISDEKGEWLRGDVAGIVCAHYLGAQAVATPVSCNTAVEASGWFQRVFRTRIGSPYVIESMQQARAAGYTPVVGYEANGGFLTATDIPGTDPDTALAALPTRDAVIVALAVLLQARANGTTISDLVKTLPPRYTYSDRLKAFPTEISHNRLQEFSGPNPETASHQAEALFGDLFGPVTDVDTTDGVRITFENGRIAHLRASGNAPELRCYSEAESPTEARRMTEACLALAAQWNEG